MSDDMLHLPIDEDSREKLLREIERDAEQRAVDEETATMLHKYGTGMAARGLNKGELGALLRLRNSQLDTPLDQSKVDEITETAYVFAIRDDVSIDLPTITAEKRQLVPLLDEIYESLKPDITLFRHGGGLVSVRDGTITHYTPDTVVTLLSRRANYVTARFDGMFPPVRAANAVLFAAPGSEGDKIRPLDRVVNVPTLRKDGTILDAPGYDAISKLFYHPTKANIFKIRENPTQQTAKNAAEWLLDMLCDFPFVGDADRSNYIGLLLTFVVRELCGCVPLALIDAPTAGTGKSLLTKIAAITATGRAAAFGVQLESEAETRKNLTSQLRESPSIIVMDNVTDVIKSSVLAAFLTADTWLDRLLGRNKMLSLPVRTVMVATGNNIRLSGDMPRRCYRVRIDADASQPWRRGGFRHKLPDYAIDNRDMLIVALLTMARAWIVAERPRGDNPTLGSFESWCSVVGGILQYAGLPDFLGNLQEMHRDTADGEDDAGQWADWMSAIYGHFGDNAFTVKRLAEAIGSGGGLYGGALRDDTPYSLGDIGLASDRAWLLRLGVALHARKGQVYGIGDMSLKLRQVHGDSHTRQKRYKIERSEKNG
jgi:hypothetical protein